jgi:predicted component of type VI protein secretion system
MEDAAMPQEHVLSLRLALMGRPVRSYVFGKPVIQVGRDPEADVFIDNPGVSREHLRLELNPEGEYEVVDLGSANGTLLNDMPVKVKIPLRTGDTVRMGKYTMTVSYELDRRESRASDSAPKADAENHTMVLSREELSRLHERQLKAEVQPPDPPAVVARAMAAEAASSPIMRSFTSRVVVKARITAGVVGFLLGAAVGAAVVWYVVLR